MKLAKNTALERNLEKQLPIYLRASDAQHGIKAIIFFSAAEEQRVHTILKKLGIEGHKDVVLIDARNDNKPSGSKAQTFTSTIDLNHQMMNASACGARNHPCEQQACVPSAGKVTFLVSLRTDVQNIP
jgi:hypothetical protein